MLGWNNTYHNKYLTVLKHIYFVGRVFVISCSSPPSHSCAHSLSPIFSLFISPFNSLVEPLMNHLEQRTRMKKSMRTLIYQNGVVVGIQIRLWGGGGLECSKGNGVLDIVMSAATIFDVDSINYNNATPVIPLPPMSPFPPVIMVGLCRVIIDAIYSLLT